jgi:cell division protein FtsB
MEIVWKDTLISVGPFVLLLVLWFVVYIRIRAWRASQKKNLVDALQESIQTAVLPEIRALRESVDALRAEIKARDENRG